MSISALSTALCLPALDIEALLQGRTIAAISDTFRNPSKFLLFPVDLPMGIGRLESRYQAEFLGSFKATYTTVDAPDEVVIHAWAKCKTCRIFSEKDNLTALAALTAWTPEYLQELVQERHKIFVLFLQVHRFSEPLKLKMPRLAADNANAYVRVPGSWSDQGALSLLSDEIFANRQKQLIKLAPPAYPELQALQKELVFEREYSLGAMALDRDVRYLLGWSRAEETRLYDSDLSWIQQVSAIGNGLDAEEFQEVVRRCLVKLGFSGADQTDCAVNASDDSSDASISNVRDFDTHFSSPYFLVSDCKVDKHSSVSRTVIETLLMQGIAQLGLEPFEVAAKVLFASGPLTEHAQKTARRENINVIRPETLQKLTEIKARYPGAIDLIKLRAHLQAAPHGEAADEKVDQFIDETLFQIRVRAALIQSVKNCQDRTGQESVGTDTVCGAYAAFSTTDLPRLSVGEVQDMLIELSSPLAGYLGRDRASNGRSLFYFLRELSIEDDNLMALSNK